MAEELGLCKERIRQLEVKVFKKFYLLQRRKYVPVMRIYNLLTNQGHYSRSGETDHIRFLMEFREIHLPEWEISFPSFCETLSAVRRFRTEMD